MQEHSLFIATFLLATTFAIGSAFPVKRESEAQGGYNSFDNILSRQRKQQQNAEAEGFNWGGFARNVLPHVADAFGDDKNEGFDWKNLALNALPHAINAFDENPGTGKEAKAQLSILPYLPYIAPYLGDAFDKITGGDKKVLTDEMAKEQYFSSFTRFLPYILPLLEKAVDNNGDGQEEGAEMEGFKNWQNVARPLLRNIDHPQQRQAKVQFNPAYIPLAVPFVEKFLDRFFGEQELTSTMEELPVAKAQLNPAYIPLAVPFVKKFLDRFFGEKELTSTMEELPVARAQLLGTAALAVGSLGSLLGWWQKKAEKQDFSDFPVDYEDLFRKLLKDQDSTGETTAQLGNARAQLLGTAALTLGPAIGKYLGWWQKKAEEQDFSDFPVDYEDLFRKLLLSDEDSGTEKAAQQGAKGRLPSFPISYLRDDSFLKQILSSYGAGLKETETPDAKEILKAVKDSKA